MRRLLLLFLGPICALLAQPNSAPPSSEPIPEAPGPRTVCLIYWSQAAPPFGFYALPSGTTKRKPLELYGFSRSELIDLPASSTALELGMRPPPPPAGKPPRPDVTLINIPVSPSLKSALVFVFPGQGAANPWQAIVMGDDEKHFPPTSVRVVNLAPHRIASKVGKEVIELDPGENKVVSLDKTEMIRVKITVSLNLDGQWQPPAASNANSPPSGRVLFIVGSSDQTSMIDPLYPPAPGTPISPRILGMVDVPMPSTPSADVP